MDITDVIRDCMRFDNCNKQLQYIMDNCNCSAEEFQIRLFEKILKTINRSQPTFFELGSGGIDASFYSIIFEKNFNNECIILNTEPRKYLLDLVKTTFKDKHLQNAILEWGYNGTLQNNTDNTPLLTINHLVEKHNIQHIDVIHMDIQGAESKVCEEIFNTHLYKIIDYYFINTHGDEYERCLSYFDPTKYIFHFSDKMSGGYGDGLIVAQAVIQN